MSEESSKLSRRDFLKAAALAPTTKWWEPREWLDGTPKIDLVRLHGIEVYGSRHPIASTAEWSALNDHWNNRFEDKVTFVSKQKGIKRPETDYDKKDLILNPNIRYLQLGVKKSLYDNFQQEAKETGVDYTLWQQYHVDVMNYMIANMDPPSKLRTKISRIIVLDDSFDDRLPNPQLMPDALPLDIDSYWNQYWDYRGDTNPQTGKLEKSGDLTQLKVKGQPVQIDLGLIHEWFHGLYFTKDEYSLDVTGRNKQNHMPQLEINGDGYDGRRTPWTAYSVKRIEQKNLRGSYLDLRNSATQAESQDGMLRAHPDKNTLLFLDKDGNPISGTITIERALESQFVIPTERYHKNWVPGDVKKVIDGKIDFPEEYFKPHRDNKTGSIYPTTNWFLTIEDGNHDKYFLQLTAMQFNMAGTAGIREAEFKVHFTQNPLSDEEIKRDPPPQTTQNLYIVSRNENFQIPRPHETYAKISVPGTNATCVYTWGDMYHPKIDV
jgi:hypothetical protein